MKHVLHNAVHKITIAAFQVYVQPFYNSPFMALPRLGFIWINMAENELAQQRLVKVTQQFKMNH
jgi:hypothetical protein